MNVCRPLAALGPLAAILALAAPGCEGAGDGQVSGALFLRGCPDDVGAGAPVPFQLEPRYFAADTIRSAAVGQNADEIDPRIPTRLEVRLQRSSHRPEITDSFVLYLTDTDALRQRLGQPFPITAAPLAAEGAPLPAQAPPFVRASLWMHGTCPIAHVKPQLRGSITLGELGFEPGEWVAAEFAVTVEDDRGAREGAALADRDAAGQLGGSFRMRIARGRSITFP